MSYKKIKKGVYYLDDSRSIVDRSSIEFLIEECKFESINMARICLHKNKSSQLMTMLIVLLNKFVYPPHRHSWKEESYTVLEGKGTYEEYDSKGKKLFFYNLDKGVTLLNNQKNRFHAIKPISNPFVFLETTTGPFLDRPLEYIK